MPDDSRKENPDDKLLTQIREEFAYFRSHWSENYDESAKDMDCVAAKPPTDFTQQREGRPCLWPDEITQYINQANNNLRQNKRSIKISPKGEDATDKDAENRQAYIQGIEDASKAQTIYATAYESAVQCGFGYFRVTIAVTGKDKREPRLKRIENWATVYMDPDAKEADFSDSASVFVLDSMREAVFKRKYPKAQKVSFTQEDRDQAPDWFNGGNITVAEYWTREEKEVADGEKSYEVKQYITNGVEILDKTEWIGSWIPIIGVFGKEIYVRTGGQSKRMFLSMIRNGRSAQQMLAYIASQEAEEFGQMPRAAFVGYKGQFSNLEKTWKISHKVPFAILELEIPANWPPGVPPPPIPERPQFQPNPQAYEMAYERWRRVLQAAVAGSPLPTDAQKQNDKSGVALERIENAGMLGNFHFTDNFVRALHNAGMQINELITKLAESESLPDEVLGKDQKGEDLVLKVHQSEVPPESSDQLPESNLLFARRGKFAETVSDGPNYQSQREEASAFADKMWETAAQLELPQPITTQILAIATKLKNIGTYGDEIADILAPPDPNNLPPQARAIVAQMQGELQKSQQELQQLQMEKMGKVVEIQGRQALANQEYATRVMEADKDRETKLAVAEISTKAQSISERMDMVLDLMKQFHDQSHDLGMATMQQKHEKDLASQAAQNASMQSAQDAAQQAAQPQSA